MRAANPDVWVNHALRPLLEALFPARLSWVLPLDYVHIQESTPRMLEPQRDDIEALARSVFGPKCRVLAWHPVLGDHLTIGHMVIFATLVFPARVVVLKLADPQSSRAPFARAAAIQQRVARETAAPVCEALAVDDSCQRFPWRYLMAAHAPGMDWRAGLARMTPHARRDIFRQLGEATAALHSLRYLRFGDAEEADLTPNPSPTRRGGARHTSAP